MKKVLLITGLIVLAGAVVTHCGGGGARNPTDAKTKFTNPDGQVTSDNATTVMNDTLNAGGTGSGEAVMGLPFTGGAASRLAFETAVRRYNPDFRLKASSIEDCVSGDENSGTINVSCIIDAGYLTNCTGSGTLTYSVDGDITTIGFDNFGLNCPSSDIDISACNGTWAVTLSGTDVDVLCADSFSCTINGETDSFTGCVDDGDYLVAGEGGDVVCTEITINSGCTRVCGDFNTSEGTVSVTCTVSDPTSCTSWTEINEITDCTLASTACSL